MHRKEDLSSLFMKKPSQTPKSPFGKLLGIDKISQDYQDLAEEFMDDEKKEEIPEEPE